MINKVLITGINGFIGQNLAKALILDGYEVIGVSREASCTIRNVHHYEQVDITHHSTINMLFKDYKPDYVIHLAAIVHKQSMLATYNDFYEVNYLASKNIFEQCKINNVKKLFFASTVEVYGENNQEGRQVVTEETATYPKTDYARTKKLAEEALISLAKDTSMQYVIMRFAPVYGKDFTLNIDRRIYIRKAKIAYYFGKGDYFFNMCSIKNIAYFVCQELKYIEEEQEIYNLSDTINLKVKQIIALERDKQFILKLCMPYFMIALAIKIIERSLKLVGKKSILCTYNFEKIFRCTIFDNKKAVSKVGILEANMETTLYRSEE